MFVKIWEKLFLDAIKVQVSVLQAYQWSESLFYKRITTDLEKYASDFTESLHKSASSLIVCSSSNCNSSRRAFS